MVEQEWLTGGEVGMIMIDIDMPNNCDECRFNTEYGFCKAMPDNFCGNTDDRKRPEWCPLKEQQPKTGKWIPVTNGRGGHECNQCHDYAPSYQDGDENLSRFCPCCGAKMENRTD